MKKIFFFIASALLIVSCSSQKEELSTPFQAGQEVTLNASIADNNATPSGPQRVSGLDSNPGSTSGTINLTWDAGDQIQVTVGDKSAVFTLCSGAGSATGSFTGTMPAAGSSYQVVYPANYSENVLTTQTYVPNGFGKGLMKMSTKVAGTIDGGFSLSADNALLGLQLTGDVSLGKIVLTNPANSKTYTLNCSGVALTSAVKVFYIVVPTGTWANGFAVDVYASDNSTKIKTLSKGSSVTFSSTSTMLMPSQAVEGGTQSVGFSVSATKKVIFSPGNLQYTQSTNTWSFASAQYEMIGTDNVTGGSVTSNPTYGDSKEGTALADKIDLFGWGTGNNPTNSSTNDNDYQTFVDWGTNQIGSDAPNTWRTLTYDDWYYLLYTRANASSLKGVAQVNGVNGLILLPDNWTCPAGVTFKSGFHSSYGVEYYAAYQTFTAEQWSKLESAGAVFLPAAGYRDGSGVGYVQRIGYYWSATEYNSLHAYSLYFPSVEAGMGDGYRSRGRSVRLVKDIEGGGTTQDTPTNTENGYEYVDLGLSVKWATCNVGASTPEEYGDYFAWGETQPKDTYNWSTYKWCNGSSNSQTKYCTNSSYGTVDNKTTLDLSDDAARANWGGSWRMPTEAELTELRTECTWTWTTENGLNGYKVTSKSNGNSIFLPAAGYRFASTLYGAGSSGGYWSSSLYTDSPCDAYVLYFYSSDVSRYDYRYHGQSVRPVCQ